MRRTRVSRLAFLLLGLATAPAYSYRLAQAWEPMKSPWIVICKDGFRAGIGLDSEGNTISNSAVHSTAAVVCKSHGGITEQKKGGELEAKWPTMLMVPGYANHALYLSAEQFGDFNGLATQALSGLTLDVIHREDGTVTTPLFAATQVESGIQTGVGAVLRVRDWLALDLGLSFGSGTAARSSINAPAIEKAAFRLFAGHVTAKVYPLQVERVQPWLSAGARGLALRPTGGSPMSTEDLDLPGRRFEPVSTADFVAGAGVDVRLTDRLGLTFSGDHGLSTGWRAGVAMTFLYPWPDS